MIERKVALHNPSGGIVMISVDRIGVRRRADRAFDQATAKSVLHIEGQYQAVTETLEEIEALIKALP